MLSNYENNSSNQETLLPEEYSPTDKYCRVQIANE
jgi:hypothetical protein